MRSRYIVKEVLKEATIKLSDATIERASREAQLLLMAYLKVDELWLITHQNDSLEDISVYFQWIERRTKNEPYEYITNRVDFYSETFYIDERALIPRPETELLIDEVLKHIDDKNSVIQFAEVGVGSGIISIMLAKFLPHAKFIAVDISQEALDVAQKNIEKFQLEQRIELRLGSLLEPIHEKIDYLISNPPYIEAGFPLESNLSYEPQNALFGGEIGDEIIRELLDEVLRKQIKFFSCEIGYDQQDRIRNYLKMHSYKSLEFYKDYSAFDRGFNLIL